MLHMINMIYMFSKAKQCSHAMFRLLTELQLAGPADRLACDVQLPPCTCCREHTAWNSTALCLQYKHNGRKPM